VKLESYGRIEEGGNMVLLKGSQAAPARPSDKSRVKVSSSGYFLLLLFGL
jgi:hypothetical protein